MIENFEDLFFAFDGLEVSWHFEQADARREAYEILSRMRQHAAETGEWPEESEAVCWGRATESVVAGIFGGELELAMTPSALLDEILRVICTAKTHGESEMMYELEPGVFVPAVDVVADLCGVPQDNTAETNACEIANATGEWPERAYCRDWIYDSWQNVREGKWSIFEWVCHVRASQESDNVK